MIGAIVGDIAGSRFEFKNRKSKEFDLFHKRCRFTDDSIMSLAVCQALIDSMPDYKNLSENTIKSMQIIGREYPNRGFGRNFRSWIFSDNPKPYNSFGNGSAMRVSGCGYAANSIEDAIHLSHEVTKISHNHPEGMKGAESAAVAVYLARTGKSIKNIQDYINEHYYQIDFTLDEIRETYQYEISCQNSVPQAFEAFFESISFEDAIRNAISIGGDSDTIAAVTGSVAGAYYGVPNEIRNAALEYLDDSLKEILINFENKFIKSKE